MGPDGFDLFGCHHLSQGAQSPGNDAGLVLGMVNEIDENIDDAGRIQFLASRWRGELLPLGPLLGGWFLFGAEVDIGVLEGFPSQFVGRAPGNAGCRIRADATGPGVPHEFGQRVRFPPNGSPWRATSRARRSRSGDSARGLVDRIGGC